MTTKQLLVTIVFSLVLVTLTGTPLGAQVSPTADGANLTLSPSSHSVQVGDIFTLDIMADPGIASADTVDAYIDFAPTYLEVVDGSGVPATTIELNSGVFSSATINTVDNETGQINVSATRFDSPLTGVFTAATIRFRAKAAVDTTEVAFVQNGARWSDLYLFGENLDPTVKNANVTVVEVPCYDLDDSGVVGLADVQSVAGRWRLTATNSDPDNDPDTPNYKTQYDIVFDGRINILDIMAVVDQWNGICQ